MSFVKLQDGRSVYALDSIRLRNQREATTAPPENTFEIYVKDGVLYQLDENGVEKKVVPDLSEITLNDLAEEILNQLTPKGSLSAFAGTVAPTGWLLCQGQSLSQTEYNDLYTVIGTAYGDGSTGTVYGTPGGSRFNIPDLRGRFLRGVDGGVGLDPDRASRTAAATGGNTGDAIGSVQSDEYKLHKHGITMSHETGGGKDATGYPATDASAPIVSHSATQPDGSSSSTDGSGNPLSSTGGSETRPKNINVNYIIKL